MTGAVGAGAGRPRHDLGDLRGPHTRRPNHCPAGDPLLGLTILDRDSSRVDLGHPRVLTDGHAEFVQPLRGLGRCGFAERRDHALAGIEQDHPSSPRVDPPEVALHRVAGEDRQLSADLHPGRARADNHERQPLILGRGIGRPLGLLEGAENPVAEVHRVPQSLEPAGDFAPLVVSKIRCLAAARDDQAVVVQTFPSVEHYLTILDVQIGDGGHHHGGVCLALEHMPDRRGYLARGQRPRGHLVDERLK